MGTTNVNRSSQILTLTLPHPPPTNTSLEVWIWTSAHSHKKGVITRLHYSHQPSGKCSDCRLNLLNLQVCNYRCECSRCRVRVRVIYTSFLVYLIILMKKRSRKFTANDSWKYPVPFGRSGRKNVLSMRELRTPLATVPQSYADLADFRRSVRDCSGSRRALRGDR